MNYTLNTKPAPFRSGFYHSCVKATINQLRAIIGEPSSIDRDPDEKSQFDWTRELVADTGEVIKFTVYDWKENYLFGYDEPIYWHIGGQSRVDTDKAKDWLESQLSK